VCFQIYTNAHVFSNIKLARPGLKMTPYGAYALATPWSFWALSGWVDPSSSWSKP
jgi:hypothetical protein